MKQTKKLDKEAKDWLRSHLFYALYDCSDSMHDAEKLEARFSALANDKFGVKDYVFKFHFDEYINSIVDIAKENGEEVGEANWKEFLNGTPSRFPEVVLNYFSK